MYTQKETFIFVVNGNPKNDKIQLDTVYTLCSQLTNKSSASKSYDICRATATLHNITTSNMHN